MAEEAAIEVTLLSKTYGDHDAVSGLDLIVRRGEVHGLLGPNGAGKTTALRVLLGLVSPDRGTVRLLGRGAGTAESPVPGGVAGFASTPQVYPYLSGRRNLELLSRLDDARSEPARIAEVLAQVGLTPVEADARCGGYSSGMRQRLGLAAALLRSPSLLLLDEPTNSLDPAGARDLRQLIRRLAADGVAVLLSSHDMSEVHELCKNLTIVHHGRVAFAGTLEHLRRQAPAAVHRLVTGDDEGALAIANAQAGLTATVAVDGLGLDVSGDQASLDGYVVALGRGDVAIRSLESRDRSLESLFLKLTADPEVCTLAPPEAPAPESAPEKTRLRGVRAVVAVECAKLAAQMKAWAVLAVCLVGPFVFTAAMSLQTSLPEDTLFGRFVKASGPAVPLVVLGFAASWGFPVLASVVGGDLFSAEDRYGTWPTLLTRSRTRSEIFLGKVLTASLFSLGAVCLLGISSLLAGVILVGEQPLVGLTGTQLAPGRSLALVALAWVSVLPPVIGFTSLAVLLSVATRSSAAGVGLPVVIGFFMELFSFVNGPETARRVMLTAPFGAWHGLFTEPPFYRPMIQGIAVSCVYAAGCLVTAYVLLRRRDMG
jgi:ABC-type multidrug transport system ATPase subunit/ABC-type transport system involved in multi-copper enzyme maturation permease subunit